MVPQQTRCYKEVMDISENNKIGLCSLIQTELWSDMFSENDIKSKWISFYSIFNYYFNIACPKVRQNIASAKKASWINKVVKARIKLRNLYDLYLLHKSQEHKDIYKTYKREYNAVIKTAEINYMQNTINRSTNIQMHYGNL
jgi:hypothetical protein